MNSSGYIPSPDELIQSQRSRFQLADSVEDDEADGEEGNGLGNEAVRPVVNDDDVVINLSSTTEDSLATTEADVNVDDSVNNNNTLERSADPSLPEMKPTTPSVLQPTEMASVKTTAGMVPTPTQDPRLTYDDSEWKPLFVNTRTTPSGSHTKTSSEPSSVTAHNSTTLMDDLKNHAPAHEDGHDAHAEESPGDYEAAEEEGQEETTDLPPDVKQDRIIEGTAAEDKGTAAGEETPTDQTTSPLTPTKFSFLQWFNAQLNNVKLAQNRQQTNGTTTLTLPSGPSSSTRFFTLKPTAVSYSGIQPILRPKPWVDNATEPAEAIPAAPTAGFVMSSLNRTVINEAAGAFLPRPFQVQTSLTLAKEPGRLVESPRSQKSLSLMDSDHLRMPPTMGTTPRELQSERQQQVELLKDFFPPVRRPSARPQITKSGPIQQDNLPISLPIEGLFTTLKPLGGHNDEGSKHRSNTNSPIYTFKLNQGQSVHDVLSQLLADLTVGESPAQVEIDGAAPSLTLAQQQQQQQQQNNDIKNKASNKKVDDDRLKPWAHMPFRPSILNALYHNTRQNLSSGTGANVEVSVPANTTTTIVSATPIMENEDAIVTTEIANRTPTSSNQHPVTSWPTDSPTGNRCGLYALMQPPATIHYTDT